MRLENAISECRQPHDARSDPDRVEVAVKAWVREAEHLEVGDAVHVRLVVDA